MTDPYVLFVQVLQQFEEFGAPDVVISLAKTAIGVADDDDPNVVSYIHFGRVFQKIRLLK